MHNINNKGYLLVEIILASALAIGMAYFMIQLTMKAKNRNDNLLVKSLTSTDQGIIYNYFMKKIYSYEKIDHNKITIDGTKKVLKYDGDVVINLNKYASFGDKKIINNQSIEGNTYDIIVIPITVKNLEDENFNIFIYIQYENI